MASAVRPSSPAKRASGLGGTPPGGARPTAVLETASPCRAAARRAAHVSKICGAAHPGHVVGPWRPSRVSQDSDPKLAVGGPPPWVRQASEESDGCGEEGEQVHALRSESGAELGGPFGLPAAGAAGRGHEAHQAAAKGPGHGARPQPPTCLPASWQQPAVVARTDSGVVGSLLKREAREVQEQELARREQLLREQEEALQEQRTALHDEQRRLAELFQEQQYHMVEAAREQQRVFLGAMEQHRRELLEHQERLHDQVREVARRKCSLAEELESKLQGLDQKLSSIEAAAASSCPQDVEARRDSALRADASFLMQRAKDLHDQEAVLHEQQRQLAETFQEQQRLFAETVLQQQRHFSEAMQDQKRRLDEQHEALEEDRRDLEERRAFLLEKELRLQLAEEGGGSGSKAAPGGGGAESLDARREEEEAFLREQRQALQEQQRLVAEALQEQRRHFLEAVEEQRGQIGEALAEQRRRLEEQQEELAEERRDLELRKALVVEKELRLQSLGQEDAPPRPRATPDPGPAADSARSAGSCGVVEARLQEDQYDRLTDIFQEQKRQLAELIREQQGKFLDTLEEHRRHLTEQQEELEEQRRDLETRKQQLAEREIGLEAGSAGAAGEVPSMEQESFLREQRQALQEQQRLLAEGLQEHRRQVTEALEEQRRHLMSQQEELLAQRRELEAGRAYVLAKELRLHGLEEQQLAQLRLEHLRESDSRTSAGSSGPAGGAAPRPPEAAVAEQPTGLRDPRTQRRLAGLSLATLFGHAVVHFASTGLRSPSAPLSARPHVGNPPRVPPEAYETSGLPPEAALAVPGSRRSASAAGRAARLPGGLRALGVSPSVHNASTMGHLAESRRRPRRQVSRQKEASAAAAAGCASAGASTAAAATSRRGPQGPDERAVPPTVTWATGSVVAMLVYGTLG